VEVETYHHQQILDLAVAVVVHRGSRWGCYCFGPAVEAEEGGMTFLPRYFASGKISEKYLVFQLENDQVKFTVKSEYCKLSDDGAMKEEG